MALVHAWSQVYPGAASAPALTSAALAKINVVTHECIPIIAAAYADRPLADYVDTAVLMAAPWDTLLERNAAGRQPIGVPVLVVQGTGDPLVPAAVTEAFVQRLCQLGAAVQLRLYPDVGHGDVIAAAMPDMLDWAAGRRQGEPAPSTCTLPEAALDRDVWRRPCRPSSAAIAQEPRQRHSARPRSDSG